MSKQKRNAIFAAALLLLLIIIIADRLGHIERSSTTQGNRQTLKIPDHKKYHGRIFNVVKVVDGDTIDIDIPDGEYGHTRIRLWGVDTPETKSSPKGLMYFGPEAKDFVTRLVLGKNVTVYLDENNNTRGKYGRLLGYVQLDDRSCLNELLLTEGYAYADSRFQHSFYNKYKQLESAARSLDNGLWQDVTREQLPEWLRRKRPKLLSK